MINVSNDFKIKTKKIKQQDVKLTINSGELAVKDIHFMPVDIFNKLPIWRLRKKKQVIAKEIKYSFEGKLFKTIMKQIEITVKNAKEIKEKDINFKYGIYVNDNYEYIDLGDFYIKDMEDSKSKDELTVTGYDKMIRFMKTFKHSELQLVYPCTLLTLILKMCEVCGVELYSTNFFNADLVVDEDYFTPQELTYRDVLEKIAQSTLTTAFIKDNKLYLCKIGNEIVSKLDKTYLTDLVIKEKFGPVNALVLGRGDVEDNVESKDDGSISKNGRTEIRFDENELVEYKREKVIDSMFKQIKGLEYYSFEGADLGVMWLEPCDLIELSDREDNIYKSIYLSANITINTGIISDIRADLIEETNTEYKVTTKEEKKTLRVERLAKKHEGLIQDIIEENSETFNKLTLHEQTIDSMKDTLKSQETKIETVESKANTAKNTADTATSMASAAQSTANTANTTANNAKTIADANTKKIQTTTTKLTEVEKTVDGIKQTVNETKQTLEDNYSTTEETEAKIQQASNSIVTSVNKKITEIQVDADNLLLNTALKKDTSNFSLASGVTRVTDKLTPNNNYCFKYNISGLTSDAYRSANPTTVSLNVEETVTASANVYVPSGVTNSNIKIEIQFFKADGTRIKTFANVVDLTKTNTWQKVSVTGTAPAETTKANARVWIQRNGQCWVGDLKLGRGNTVTSWCPSSKDYPTTKEFGTLVEQNWEHVKVAWNTICEYLQLENLKGNASLVVRDGNGKLIMSLDKTGQHYWTQKNNIDKNIAETTLKDITINNQTKKALMFLLDNAEMNGEGIMAWGYKNGNNVYPVLYVGNFGNEEFGLHLATDLIAHANAIKFQNAQIDDDGANLYLRTLGALKIIDTENNTDIAQFFKDYGQYGFSIKADDFSILDSNGQTPLLEMYTNDGGNKVLDLSNVILLTNTFYANNLIDTNSVSSMNGYTSVLLGEKRGYITCSLKNGDVFTLEGYGYDTSDERLKENIQKTKLNALERIKQLNHVEFDWKLTKEHEEIGYIAQELEKIDKNYVVKIPNPQNDDVKYTVRTLSLLATTTKAIQELNEKVEKQDKLIKLLLEKLNIREEDTNA